MRTVRPLLVQRAAAAAFQVQSLQRAGHGIEPGRENDDVELVFLAPRSDALLGDLLYSAVGSGIDQLDVGLVEGLVVVGVERLALGAVRITLGG